MTPDQYKNMDWELLRKQKEYLLKLKSPLAEGLVHLVDAVQDYAVDVLKVDEKKVFDFKK